MNDSQLLCFISIILESVEMRYRAEREKRKSRAKERANAGVIEGKATVLLVQFGPCSA
jgi:3-deoxy-D-arabino-heptulosonate 7-phosphate (DAHP) synthase